MDMDVSRPHPAASDRHTASAQAFASPSDIVEAPRLPLPNAAQSLASPQYTVFISHAGEDKATIAMPLRERLRREGITAFVDEPDMPPGTDAKHVMTYAMETAIIGVIVLSPESVARKWPMRELMCFLKRRKESMMRGSQPAIIIPCFYRLAIDELYDEPRLDRLDKNGNELYKESRFYARQRSGEPEASIRGIKDALEQVRGLMGVRNDVNATNDSSLLMETRRNILLDDLCGAVCRIARMIGVAKQVRTQNNEGGHDLFEAHFDTSYDFSDLVLDFDTKDENGNRCTQEGKVLEILLDTAESRNRAISVKGRAGVGKTSLLGGIRELGCIRTRFRDGVYFMALGIAATRGEVIEQLCQIVERSGGKESAKRMRSASDIIKVVEELWKRFEGKQCLFIVDDVWKTEEISSVIIHKLLTLHKSGRDSKVLLTTRGPEIAARAEISFELETREVLAEESRAILFQYSRLKPGIPRKDHKEDNDAVDGVLKRCGGLPLFLAVAGRAVKTLSLRRGHSGCRAYRQYGKELEKRLEKLVDKDIDSYEGLAARLLISVRLLEERHTTGGFGVRTNVGVREMHRRLNVVTKQARIPMTMLRHLWELEDEWDADSVAKEFEQVGLVDMEFTTRGDAMILRLHDSVHDFAVYETKKRNHENTGHKVLIRGYASELRMTQHGCKEWWSTCVKADDYIHGNVCRHLSASGNVRELTMLLLRPQWLARQIDVSGLLTAESDFSVGIKAVQEGSKQKRRRRVKILETALMLIKDAVSLSSGSVFRNPREVWFQIHGRLLGRRDQNELIREYVKWIEDKSPRPRLLSKNRILVEPGGPNTRIIHVGGDVRDMVLLPDGERAVCNLDGGRLVVVNVRRSDVENEWVPYAIAQNVVISPKAGVDGGTRVVTGSGGEPVKVWNVETGRCIATFTGHRSVVTCVAISDDGKWAACGCDNGRFQVWLANTAHVVVSKTNGLHLTLSCIAFMENGRKVLTAGQGAVLIWDTWSGTQDFWLRSREMIDVTLCASERRLVMRYWEKLEVFDLTSHKKIQEISLRDEEDISCVSLDEDGDRVISGSYDGTITTWNVCSGKKICDSFTSGQLQPVSGISFLWNEDGMSIVSSSRDGSVRVSDMNRRYPEEISSHYNEDIWSVCFTADSKFLLSGSEYGEIRIWDVETGKSSQLSGTNALGHTEGVNGIAVTPDGRFMVSAAHDRTVRVWDLRDLSLLHTFTGHKDWITCVATSPDGNRAVTGSYDGTVRVWDLEKLDGNHIVLVGPHRCIERVLFSNDALRIISYDLDGNVSMWDLETTMRINEKIFMNLHGEPIGDIAPIRAIGRHIVLGRQRDVSVLGTLDDNILHLEVSPDGQTICAELQKGSRHQLAFIKLDL